MGMEKTPAQLLLRAQNGDADAFGALYALYADELYAYALYVLGRRPDAEDAVQETCLRVYRSIRSIRKPDRIKAYFFKALSNTIRTMRRQAAPAPLPDDAALPDPADEAAGADLRADLKAALDALQPDERQVVLLSAVAGLRSAEVGDAVGLTAGAARSKLSRALRKMRPYLTEPGRETE